MENFHDLTTIFLFNNLTEDEIFVFDTVNEIFKDGLSFLKKGNNTIGNIYIEKAVSLTNLIDKESCLYNALLLNYYPKKALFYYNLKNFTNALLFTSKCIDQCKFYSALNKNNFFLLFNIQQYHNISRIFFKQGKVDIAIIICCSCLNYLFMYIEKATLIDMHEKAKDSIIVCIRFIYQIYFDMLLKLLQVEQEGKGVISYYNYIYTKLRFPQKRVCKNYDELNELLSVLELFSFLHSGKKYIFFAKGLELAESFTKSELKESKKKMLDCLNKYIDYLKFNSYEIKTV